MISLFSKLTPKTRIISRKVSNSSSIVNEQSKDELLSLLFVIRMTFTDIVALEYRTPRMIIHARRLIRTKYAAFVPRYKQRIDCILFFFFVILIDTDKTIYFDESKGRHSLIKPPIIFAFFRVEFSCLGRGKFMLHGEV